MYIKHLWSCIISHTLSCYHYKVGCCFQYMVWIKFTTVEILQNTQDFPCWRLPTQGVTFPHRYFRQTTDSMLYIDNFSPSPDLSDDVHKRAIKCSGTVGGKIQGMQGNLANQILKPKLGNMHATVWDNLAAMIWKDKCIFFYRADGGSKFLWNTGSYLHAITSQRQ